MEKIDYGTRAQICEDIRCIFANRFGISCFVADILESVCSLPELEQILNLLIYESEK